MSDKIISEIKLKYLKEEFIKQIEYRYALNLSMMLLEEFENLQQQNKQLNEQVIIMEKYLELITDLALDYDGCNTIESLKRLIDELDRLACLGRVCNVTEPIYANENKKYNILHQELEKGDSNE